MKHRTHRLAAKAVAAILCAALMLTACGSKETTSNETASTETTSATATETTSVESTETTVAEPTAEPAETQSIAKHTLVYRERHHRYQQCRGVYNVVDIAESVRAEPARIKTKHDIHEELRAKLPQRQNKGVACQLLVLIHADILSL